MTQRFQILTKARTTPARTAVLDTAGGPVRTPVFMPVGTRAAVKGLTPHQLADTGAVMLLANTYHLLLRPGIDAVEKTGGLHKFMAWNKPILTDSGGFQVFSLNSLTRVDDRGVEFTSHIDGQKLYLDPAVATNAQNRLGADIIMCFDQPAALPCEHTHLARAVKRTLTWARICRDKHANPDQMLFGIVQGGLDMNLRENCAGELVAMDFDGYAIGGLSVGETTEDMLRTCRHTAAMLPEDRPRYLMGVGSPADIIAAVRAGVDMFDCVMPTRNGRNALAFTEQGPIRLRNACYLQDDRPVQPGCDCYCCREFTRAAVRHFFNVGEMLGPILLSIHNLHFYQRLMAEIRTAIDAGRFAQWAESAIAKYRASGM